MKEKRNILIYTFCNHLSDSESRGSGAYGSCHRVRGPGKAYNLHTERLQIAGRFKPETFLLSDDQ